MTLPIPSVHGNEVVEASVEELLQCQLEVHDLVQFTPVATGLVLHIVSASLTGSLQWPERCCEWLQVTIGYSQLSAG